MPDRLLLLGEDPVHQVADGNHPDDPVAFDHGEMADASIGHNAHALLDRMRWGYGDDVAGHDVRNGGVLGMAALENDLAGVIALRDDANKLTVTHDEQRADRLFGHETDGFVDGSR